MTRTGFTVSHLRDAPLASGLHAGLEYRGPGALAAGGQRPPAIGHGATPHCEKARRAPTGAPADWAAEAAPAV